MAGIVNNVYYKGIYFCWEKRKSNNIFTSHLHYLHAWGTLLGILGWVVPPTSPNPDPVSEQKMSFSTPVFRSGLENAYRFLDLEVVTKPKNAWLHKTEIMSSLLRLKPQQKDFLKSISNSHIETETGIETTNTLIHNRSSFLDLTRFQSKMGKIYTRFQTKRARKPYPLFP